MNLLAAAFDWTDPASIGYPALGAGVLLGSIVPVVPTGAVVGAAAAIATTTGRLWLPAVIALATVAALVGDLVTFAAGRAGSGLALRLVTRGQTPERLAAMRERFAAHGGTAGRHRTAAPRGPHPGAARRGRARLPVAAVRARRGPRLPAVGGRATRCWAWSAAGSSTTRVVATLLATVLVLVVAGGVGAGRTARRRQRT